jgi:hypothetical protein
MKDCQRIIVKRCCVLPAARAVGQSRAGNSFPLVDLGRLQDVALVAKGGDLIREPGQQPSMKLKKRSQVMSDTSNSISQSL